MSALYHSVIFDAIPFGVLPFGMNHENSGDMSTKPNATQMAVVTNRRRQLAKWIDEKFDGSHTAFIASTHDGEKQLNQGELSALLRNKSFGEKRARSLEVQAGMPISYLEETDEPVTEKPGVTPPARAKNIHPLNATRWPFKKITPEQWNKNLKPADRLMAEGLIWTALGEKLQHKARKTAHG